MQVSFPIYKNNPYVANNQRQNFQQVFTSKQNTVEITQAIMAGTINPFLKKIKDIMLGSEMQGYIDILKKNADGTITEGIKQQNLQISNIIREKLRPCLRELNEDTSRKGIIELFTSTETDNLQNGINKLISKYGVLDLIPFPLISENINNNAASMIKYNILHSIKEMQVNDHIHDIILSELAASLEILQTLFGKAVV